MTFYDFKHLLSKWDVTFSIYLFLRNMKNDANRIIPDELYAKLLYKRKTNKKLDLKNPKTYDEKIWWLKFHDKSELHKICSDKILVRDYVKRCGLEHILTTIGGGWENYKDVDFSSLPDKCILKCNHTSGCNMFYDRGKPFSFIEFRKEFGYWMSRDYYWSSREYNYKGIKRKIFWEEIIETEDEYGLIDYRFMCFNGIVKFVMVDVGTTDELGRHAKDSKRNVYDRDFNLQDVRITRERFDPTIISKPLNWDEMIRISECLSAPFIHCRVDLYNVKGKIFFGEITFHHAGGVNIITPDDLQYTYGDYIQLPANDK